MKPEAQRIAIAEFCGWKRRGDPYPCQSDGSMVQWWAKDGTETSRLTSRLTDYLNDMNAMHEAEKIIQQSIPRRNAYAKCLRLNIDMPLTDFFFAHATAAQRAEALLRTIGKWKDE